MILLMQIFFLSFCVIGVTKFSSMIAGDPTEWLFWYITVCVSLGLILLWDVFLDMYKRESSKQRSKHEDEDYEKRKQRLMIIQKICNRNMATAEGRNRIKFKDHVVVPYDDLLKIWDFCDRIKHSE